MISAISARVSPPRFHAAIFRHSVFVRVTRNGLSERWTTRSVVSLRAGSRWSTERARLRREFEIERHLFTRLLPAGSLLFATRACDSSVSLLAGYSVVQNVSKMVVFQKLVFSLPKVSVKGNRLPKVTILRVSKNNRLLGEMVKIFG